MARLAVQASVLLSRHTEDCMAKRVRKTTKAASGTSTLVAAAEAAVGLAIVISLFRHRHSLNPDSFTTLKW